MRHILHGILESHGKLSHYLLFLALTLAAVMAPTLLAIWLL